MPSHRAPTPQDERRTAPAHRAGTSVAGDLRVAVKSYALFLVAASREWTAVPAARAISR